jgi:hypothetical protein
MPRVSRDSAELCGPKVRFTALVEGEAHRACYHDAHEEVLVMSKVITLTNEQYAIISQAAQAAGQSEDEFLARLIDELRDPTLQPRYYETDEWMRHLGVSEERITHIQEAVEAEDADEAERVRKDAHA